MDYRSWAIQWVADTMPLNKSCKGKLYFFLHISMGTGSVLNIDCISQNINPYELALYFDTDTSVIGYHFYPLY